MAENKGIMLAKSVQKHAGRAKEKLLISLGKVQRTEDDIFDEHLNNFNRQQQQANRLQKEFNNYIRCIKATQAASKNLMDAISEIYEPQWSGYETLQAQVSAAESLWQDYSHKLSDQVLIPLSTYTGQFPEMKKKVEKRNRKLIDFDGQRHSYKNMQENANKRKDDVKLAKARDQLEDARRTYELLNTELHEELPALFESRILFLVTNLQTLFATEQVFHNETSKIFAEFEAIADKLASESQRNSNSLRKPTSNILKATSPTQSTPVKQLNNANITNNVNSNQYQNQITSNGTGSNRNPPSPSTSLEEPRLDSISPTPSEIMENASSIMGNEFFRRTDKNTIVASETFTTATTKLCNDNMNNKYDVEGNEKTDDITLKKSLSINSPRCSGVSQLNSDNNINNAQNFMASSSSTMTTTTTTTSEAATPTEVKSECIENVHKVAKNYNDNVDDNEIRKDVAKTTVILQEEKQTKLLQMNDAADLPPGVLYRVKATYGYVKEDTDELSFEVGDIIRVIEYDDPEDQEEGWLMGQKEGTDEKGLFPANFTRPI